MAEPAWSFETVGGVEILRSELLRVVPGVSHAFSTCRADGESGFDLGGPEDARPAVLERRRRLCRVAGLGDGPPRVLFQVHGTTIVDATPPCPGGTTEGDGWLARHSASGNPVIAVRTADCVPVLIVAADGRFVATVHAGWRGTAQAVVRRAVEALAGLGVPANRLRAAIGPAAGHCCYEVGTEVIGAVAAGSGVNEREIRTRTSRGRLSLDLVRANRIQLLVAGLPASSISAAGECTVCSPRFFSYRRQGRDAGRQMALVGWSCPALPVRDERGAP